MDTIIISVFVAGYLAITLEHSLKIDKLIPALIMMAISWAFISFGIDDFGKSAPYKEIYNHFELSIESIIRKIKEKL